MIQKLKRFASLTSITAFTILIFSIQSQAAVTVDNSASAGSSTFPATLMWNHTVGTGNSRALYVTISRYDPAGVPGIDIPGIGNSVTFGTTPMTSIGYTSQNPNAVQIFRLLNPSSGTDTITVTFTTVIGPPTEYSVGTSVSFNGVDQTVTSPSLTTQTDQSSPSMMTNNEIMGTEAGDMVLDVVSAPPGAGLFSPGMSQTLRGAGNFSFSEPFSQLVNLGGNANVGATSTKPATMPDTTLNWTLTNVSTWITGGTRVKGLGVVAASGTISGRVLSSRGRGISQVTVMLTGGNGENLVARTNQFGYYRFEDIEVGDTYILQARNKRYAFAPLVINFDDSISNLNIYPINK